MAVKTRAFHFRLKAAGGNTLRPCDCNITADALAGAVAAATGDVPPEHGHELETVPQIFTAAPVFIRPGALALLGGELTDRGRS
jgi:hypothetical protein